MSSRRKAFFHAWAHWIAGHTRTVLWGAAIATLAAGVAIVRLEIHAGRVDLLGERDPVARDWLAFGADFGSPNGIVLLLEGGSEADRRRAVDAIVAVLRTREHDLYRNILYRVDSSFQETYGAYYVPADALRRAKDAFESLGDGTLSSWPTAFHEFENQLRTLGPERLNDPANATAFEAVVQLVERWATAVETGADLESPLTLPLSTPLATEADLTPVDAQGYLISNDGARHLVLIDPRSEREDAAAFLLPFMRTLFAAIDAGTSVPGVHVRMTGMSAYAYQDLEVISTEIPWLTLLSAIGLVLIFRAAFRTLRPALFAGGALLLSLIWTLGLTALTVGHLTLLSSVFGMILIGLGIDYGIYLVVLYTQARRDGDPADALAEAFVRGVNGILTGGATTAAAFALCGIADFAAFAELGQITAMGIGCNLVTMLTVLPALLIVGERRAAERGGTLTVTTDDDGPLERAFAALGRALERRIWIGLLAGIALAAWGIPALKQVPFDYTFLNMQPLDTPFPEAEEILAETTNFAPHFNLLLGSDPADAARLARAAEKLKTVRRTLHIAQLVPAPDPERDALVADVRRAALQVERLPTPDAAQVEAVDAALNRIRIRFSAFERASFGMEDKVTMQRLQRIVRALERLQQARGALPPAEWARRHAAFLDAMDAAVHTLLDRLQTVASEPPTVNDLPVALRRRFVGRSGRHAVYVIPTRSLWDIDFLLQFNKDVRTVAPEVTGIGMILGELYMASSAAPRQVGGWVILVIVGVLLLDYRDPRPVIAGCGALGLGVISVVGLMHARGMEFNPINILAFPLLLGIGIDNSVHILHRFRSADRPSFETVFRTTGKAVFLASLTSFVSFGLLALSTHRGLSSFGKIMAAGVVCCYLAAVLVLPCFWRLANRIWGEPKQPTDSIES